MPANAPRIAVLTIPQCGWTQQVPSSAQSCLPCSTQAVSAITLADIVEAVEGPIALTSCAEHGKHDCALEGSCCVQPHWGIVNTAMRGALAGIPLTQLSQAREPA